jgi:hypothetical protein
MRTARRLLVGPPNMDLLNRIVARAMYTHTKGRMSAWNGVLTSYSILAMICAKLLPHPVGFYCTRVIVTMLPLTTHALRTDLPHSTPYIYLSNRGTVLAGKFASNAALIS